MSFSTRPLDNAAYVAQLNALPLQELSNDDRASLSPRVQRIVDLLSEGYQILEKAGLRTPKHCAELQAAILENKPYIGENADRIISLLKTAEKNNLLHPVSLSGMMKHARFAKEISLNIIASLNNAP